MLIIGLPIHRSYNKNVFFVIHKRKRERKKNIPLLYKPVFIPELNYLVVSSPTTTLLGNIPLPTEKMTCESKWRRRLELYFVKQIS